MVSVLQVYKSKEKLGYHTLSAEDEEEGDEGHGADQLAIGKERGHGRSTSLDLKKMIASSDVYSDMPAAEPPRPPPVSSPHHTPSHPHTLLYIYSSETSG